MVGCEMHRQRRIPVKEQIEAGLAEVGGEALAGSGFEDEVPNPVFSEGPEKESIGSALKPIALMFAMG
jgi:hypothetical protein